MATTHKPDCKRVFSRYDMSCPRCQELAGGAPAREGWGDRRRKLDEQRSRWIKEHDCRKAGCGPVCTAFDY